MLNAKNWDLVSPYFKPHEILSPETLPYLHLVEPFHLFVLNVARHRFGAEILCNKGVDRRRGVRSAREVIAVNQSDNGGLFTMHGVARANDLTPKKKTENSINDLELILRGMGFYVIRYSSFLHADSRLPMLYDMYAHGFALLLMSSSFKDFLIRARNEYGISQYNMRYADGASETRNEF